MGRFVECFRAWGKMRWVLLCYDRRGDREWYICISVEGCKASRLRSCPEQRITHPKPGRYISVHGRRNECRQPAVQPAPRPNRACGPPVRFLTSCVHFGAGTLSVSSDCAQSASPVGMPAVSKREKGLVIPLERGRRALGQRWPKLINF